MQTTKTVDRESQEKLYVQMYAIIKIKIESREWPAGTQIPTEDELCKKYDVSKATVRMAISELVRNGYLKKQQGKGTFVTYSQPELGITMKTRLTEDMFREGVKVKKEILVKGVQEAGENIREYLKAERNIYYILCKRVVEGETAYLEESFLPLALLPSIEGEDICQLSFYDLVQQKADQKIYKVIQTIEITEAGADAAAILKTEEGSPVLLLHRLFIGADGNPIAYTRLTGSGRKYKIQTELERIA
jgi:GntR family transcriptional regulator